MIMFNVHATLLHWIACYAEGSSGTQTSLSTKEFYTHSNTLAYLMLLMLADCQMEYPLQGIDDAKEEIAASNRNNLRLFSAPDNRYLATVLSPDNMLVLIVCFL